METPESKVSKVHKFLQSVMIWGAMSPAMFYQDQSQHSHQPEELLEQFILPSTEKLFGEADFLLPNGLLTMLLQCLIGQSTHLT